MADRTVKYVLTFSADVSQAKGQIQGLQQSLNNLISGENSPLNKRNFVFTEQINKSLRTVELLRRQLNSAFNAETGKLDLTAFHASMKKAGMSLKTYERSLRALGPEGNKAFISLAQSIANAEVPIQKVTGKLDKLKATFVNTINWQLSSTAIRTVYRSISGAFSYAKKLDASLNNIRIVTGQSADEMAKFAEQANKAAQKLSTTTTTYTDAALIYYQQGERLYASRLVKKN